MYEGQGASYFPNKNTLSFGHLLGGTLPHPKISFSQYLPSPFVVDCNRKWKLGNAHPVADVMRHSAPDWSPWFLSWKKRDNLWDEIQINLFENFPSTRNFPLFSLTACWFSENLVYSMESEWEPTRSSAVWATLVLSSSLPGLKHICSANGYFNLTYSYVVKTILWAL